MVVPYLLLAFVLIAARAVMDGVSASSEKTLVTVLPTVVDRLDVRGAAVATHPMRPHAQNAKAAHRTPGFPCNTRLKTWHV
jgi:hypothetical protein